MARTFKCVGVIRWSLRVCLTARKGLFMVPQSAFTWQAAAAYCFTTIVLYWSELYSVDSQEKEREYERFNLA